MKRLTLFWIALFSFYFANARVTDRIITPRELPEEAQSFVNEHFSNAEIQSVVKPTRKTFRVEMSDSIVVDFDKKGRWTKIVTGSKGISETLIPKQIYKKINEKFPESPKIVEITQEKSIYRMKLSNRYKVSCTKDLSMFSITSPVIITMKVAGVSTQSTVE